MIRFPFLHEAIMHFSQAALLHHVLLLHVFASHLTFTVILLAIIISKSNGYQSFRVKIQKRFFFCLFLYFFCLCVCVFHYLKALIRGKNCYCILTLVGLFIHLSSTDRTVLFVIIFENVVMVMIRCF